MMNIVVLASKILCFQVLFIIIMYFSLLWNITYIENFFSLINAVLVYPIYLLHQLGFTGLLKSLSGWGFPPPTVFGWIALIIIWFTINFILIQLVVFIKNRF